MVKKFLDTGDLEAMAWFHSAYEGVTTNPSLLKKASVKDYRAFARDVLSVVDGKPVSFEVMSDDADGMVRQALEIASWGGNVFVKIPVCNTKGESTERVIRRLGTQGVKINCTAVMSLEQIEVAGRSLVYAPAILSVFAGRIADTGRDPMEYIAKAIRVKHADTQVLWASTREVFNVKHAEQCRCDIVTLSPELFNKLALFGKSLHEYSVETVKQFAKDSEGITL